MTRQQSIILTGITGESSPFLEIRDAFEHLVIGGTLVIQVPHRDMWFHNRERRIDNDNLFWVLPENFDPPHTFSLRHIITEALNAICVEKPKDFDRPDFNRLGYDNISEGQGFWVFTDLYIEGSYIIAVITKI